MELNDPRFASAYDEAPLWSAPFGLRLLERVRMRPGLTVLDLGCGCGLPVLGWCRERGELALGIPFVCFGCRLE